MSIPVMCPHCGATGSAPDKFAGQQVRCSKCKKPFLVGAGEAVKASGPPPAPDAKAEEIEEVEHIEEVEEIEEVDDEKGSRKEKQMARKRRDDHYDDDYDDDDDDDRGPSIRKKPKRRSGSSSSGFVDFLTFRFMITPRLAVIAFWLVAVGLFILGWFGVIVALINVPGAGAKLIATVPGFATAFVGPIILRVYIEIIIVFFRVYETLLDIKKELEN